MLFDSNFVDPPIPVSVGDSCERILPPFNAPDPLSRLISVEPPPMTIEPETLNALAVAILIEPEICPCAVCIVVDAPSMCTDPPFDKSEAPARRATNDPVLPDSDPTLPAARII